MSNTQTSGDLTKMVIPDTVKTNLVNFSDTL